MSTIHVAIPCLDEERDLPSCLQALTLQTRPADRIWVCVNQPDSWWHQPDRRRVCESNQRTLAWLRSRRDLPLVILDRSSPGRGWPDGGGGVGRARAELFSAVVSDPETRDQDLFVSLDADTLVTPGYLEALERAFHAHPRAVGLAAPYRHQPVRDQGLSRAILRYELYLRTYFLNLAATTSPYLFTALGSALTMPVDAGKKVSGPPPRPAGEDFYLLQKLAKIGPLLLWAQGEMVRPSSRPSPRVPFGTGPALIQGSKGRWDAHPIFSPVLFDEVAEALALIPQLQERDLDHPLFRFLQERSKGSPWAPLRKNHRDPARFLRACHERIDGLRILQYVRRRSEKMERNDAANLAATLVRRAGPVLEDMSPQEERALGPILEGRQDPALQDIETLETTRDLLERQESLVRQARLAHWPRHLAFYGLCDDSNIEPKAGTAPETKVETA